MAKLLIVENDSFAGTFIKSNLSLQNFTTVELAETASQAMHIFRDLKPDVALLDIELGFGPNGIDVARAMRKLNLAIGIVFLTSIQDPRLMDLKGLELPTGSFYVPKNSIKCPQEIAETLLESIDLARSGKQCEVRNSVDAPDLTSSQFELIRHIANGLSNKEIANRKVVTVKSIENAIARLAKRMKIENLSENSQRVLIAKKYFEMMGKV
jgi:DNA-binding NarL/FixJ family response regulator